ncbi:hypothetical protein M407DRAFT_23793 [Tulasnella calospora MUT 4182]|uniref:F-box domain-containing protein n=1 Tax=Tulasnella calospora MUT 4182 TaxID=1051891 RepID=A0A0C3KZY0_9AGAM|nr:hypothetical protein M407DRAFT_23793 [Tulasnella calospora MUT 4182]
MEGVTLSNCHADGVKFLFDILEDVKAVLEEESPRSTEMIELNAVKSVLSEALERYRWRSDDTGADESQNPAEGGSDAGDSDHNTGGRGKEEWDFERLCKWYDRNIAFFQAVSLFRLNGSPFRILGQVQATGLEDEKCQTIIDRLEARCGLADAATAKGTSSQARPDNSSMSKAVEGLCNCCQISLLPVELLQHVFRLASPPHIWIRAPLILSHVNSHFRTIVLDTPSLWIAVDDSLSFPILELYVARSRNKPLDIVTRVDHIYHESDRSEDNWIEFLNMGSSRVGQMTIAGYNPQFITKWAQRLKGLIFTSLTKMTVCVMKHDTSGAACPIWASFPCLRDLSIEGCWSLGWVGPRDPFPQTLRSLRLTRAHDISPETLIEALCGVLGLVSLSVEDCALDPDEPVPPTTSRVTLDFLEKLEFEDVKVLLTE